ncbi:hypothetical protein CKA32_003686 [Geitlerinema sp. FC II]|nr:hypothetical protein CKA32_003686 [Geitlerinema sp. FC II]
MRHLQEYVNKKLAQVPRQVEFERSQGLHDADSHLVGSRTECDRRFVRNWSGDRTTQLSRTSLEIVFFLSLEKSRCFSGAFDAIASIL